MYPYSNFSCLIHFFPILRGSHGNFGIDFGKADQLFLDQVQVSAENDEHVAEAARINNFADFAASLKRRLDDLLIARMEGNEDLLKRVMEDDEFCSAVHEHLAQDVFRRGA